MIVINISNVEEILFYNSKIQHILPEKFYGFFEQWKLSKRFPKLKFLGQAAVIDVLNNIGDEEIKLLENYFKERVIVEKFDCSLVRNIESSCNKNDICCKLCDVDGNFYLMTYRDKEKVYITLWR